MTRKILVPFFAALMLACGGPADRDAAPGSTGPGSGGSSGSSSSGEATGSTQAPASAPTPGRLLVKLVDAPKPEIASIFVTLTSVEADLPDGSTVAILETPVTVDLLTLQNGNFLSLGSGAVPAAEVSALRLMVDAEGGSHVVLADGSQAPLKIPSGESSGIKLDGPFAVPGCADTTVTLDFDGEKSVHAHQTGSGEFVLRPVVFVKEVLSGPVECDVDGGTDAGAAEDVDGGAEQTAVDAGETEAVDAGETELVDAGIPHADAGIN